MPDLTVVHIALLTGMLLVGIVAGWILRGGRSVAEKMSINAGWQAQIDSQQSEHDRLATQNQSLMEQISQYQNSNKDAKLRATELAESLKEAFARRDALQRQLKDIRGNLEVAIAQRDKLRSNVSSQSAQADNASLLKEKDKRIAKLTSDLAGWQQRVPPLVERYRLRDLEARQLEIDLRKANDRIDMLERMSRGEDTQIEPAGSSNLPDGLDASNEAHTETSVLDGRLMDDDFEQANDDGIADQIDDYVYERADGSRPDDAHSDEELLDEQDANELENDAVHQEDSDEDADPGSSEDYAMEASETSAPIPLRNGELLDLSNEKQAQTDANSTDFPILLDNQYATGIQHPDELQKIKGVGPAIEKTLNDLGIFRFRQIAEMSEYDIDRVAQQLKGFRSRIYREDWIGQARLLQYEKPSA